MLSLPSRPPCALGEGYGSLSDSLRHLREMSWSVGSYSCRQAAKSTPTGAPGELCKAPRSRARPRGACCYAALSNLMSPKSTRGPQTSHIPQTDKVREPECGFDTAESRIFPERGKHCELRAKWAMDVYVFVDFWREPR